MVTKGKLYGIIGAGAAIATQIATAIGTGGDSAAGVVVAGTVGTILGGLGSNLFAAFFDRHFIESPDNEEILKNGDLIRAVGRAVFILIEDEAKDLKYGSYRTNVLQNITDNSGAVWERFVNRGANASSGELVEPKDSLAIRNLTQYLRAKGGEIDNVRSLDPDAWKEIVSELIIFSGYQPDDEACKKLASRLHTDFAKAFRKILINEPMAHASMMLRICGEMLAYLKENNEILNELAKRSDGSIVKFSDLEEMINLILIRVEHLQERAEKVPKILVDPMYLKDTFDLTKDIHWETAGLQGFRADTTERLKRIEGMIPWASAPKPFETLNLPNSGQEIYGPNSVQDLGPEATAILQAVRGAKTKSDQAELLYKAGIAHQSKVEFDDALRCFELAVQFRPTFALAWSGLANMLSAAGRKQEAFVAIDKAIALSPDFAHSHYYRAILLLDEERWHDAVQSFDRAIELNPKDADAHHFRAEALAMIGRHEEALASRDSARKIWERGASEEEDLYWQAIEAACDGKLLKALDYIEFALENGFTDLKRIKDATELRILWTHRDYGPRLKRLVAEAKRSQQKPAQSE